MNISTAKIETAAGFIDGKPITLFRLAGYLIKAYVRQIPSMLIWILVRTAGCFTIVMVLHTWMVVVGNDGFRPNLQNPLYRLIAFPETKAGAVAFWGIAAFLLTSFAGRIWFGGPVKLFADFVSLPDWIIRSCRQSGKMTATGFLGGMSIALLVSLFIQSPFVVVAIAIGIFLSCLSREQGLWTLFILAVWSDFKRIFAKNKTVKQGVASVFTMGLLLGLVLAVILPYGIYGRLAALLFFIFGNILITRKKISPRALMWAGAFLLFQAVLLKAAGAFADDGGWREAGSNFGSWWGSPGRGQATGMGTEPSLAAVAGALMGGSNVSGPPVVSNTDIPVGTSDETGGTGDGGTNKPLPIPGVLNFNQDDWSWRWENGQWVLYQTDAKGNKYGTGLPQSYFDGDPSLTEDKIRMFTQPVCDTSSSMEQVDNALDSMGGDFMNQFRQDQWNNMDKAQREDSIRQLTQIIAQSTGVDPGSFQLELYVSVNNEENGVWDSNNRVLGINTNSGVFNNPAEVIKVLSHEIRHVAQSDPKADLGGGKGYRRIIEYNDKNYQDPFTDYTRYSGQIMERDADAFATNVLRRVMTRVAGNR